MYLHHFFQDRASLFYLSYTVFYFCNTNKIPSCTAATLQHRLVVLLPARCRHRAVPSSAIRDWRCTTLLAIGQCSVIGTWWTSVLLAVGTALTHSSCGTSTLSRPYRLGSWSAWQVSGKGGGRYRPRSKGALQPECPSKHR